MTPLEQDTVVPLHSEPDPTPTTLMGLQSRPRRTLVFWSTMPSSPSKAVPAAELACAQKKNKLSTPHLFLDRRSDRALTDSVLLQHAVVAPPEDPVPALVGVAAARRGRARTENEARRENMVAERGLLGAKDSSAVC